MRWRRTALLGILFIAAILIYQFAYLGCATAKLVGHGYLFDLWHGPVTRSTLQLGSIPADVYTGARSRFPLVLVHGVNETGKDSPELRPVAEMLAGAGFRVFAPEFVRMAHQNVTPQDIDDVATAFRSLGTDGGILCASYGCGPALIAAGLPDVRDKVRFIVAYGAYFDLADTFRAIITAPPSPLVYSKWVYMAANADLIHDESDRLSLIAIANEREEEPPEQWGLEPEHLGPEGRAMLDLFESETPKEFDERLAAVPALEDRILKLSPSRHFAGIKARLVIVHMEWDPAIPSSESVRMAQAAKVAGLQYSLTILDMYGHTRPAWPAFAIRSFLTFYLPESLKVMRAINEILQYA